MLWTLLWVVAGGYGYAAGQPFAGAMGASLAALPLARDIYGRRDPVWLALPLTLAISAAALGTGAALDRCITVTLVVLMLASYRRSLSLLRRGRAVDEPEDVLALAVLPQVWMMAWIALAAGWICVAIPLLVGYLIRDSRRSQPRHDPAIRPWRPRLDRSPIPVTLRLERHGHWSGYGSWTNPDGLLQIIFSLPLLPLFVFTPRRHARRWLLDDLVATWRAQQHVTADWGEFLGSLRYWNGERWTADAPGDEVRLLDEVLTVADAMHGDPMVEMELLLLLQSAALTTGRYEHAIAAGWRLAAFDDLAGLTERRHRLVRQACGETALAYAKLGRPAEAASWLARMGSSEPALETFLRPLVALLSEPPGGRSDTLYRAVAGLPWASQHPLSAPMRRWQRTCRLEQVRQRLDAGQEASGSAQGLGLDELPNASTPPDEVILQARLAAQQGHRDQAEAYLRELLQRRASPALFVEQARAELQRLA